MPTAELEYRFGRLASQSPPTSGQPVPGLDFEIALSTLGRIDKS